MKLTNLFNLVLLAATLAVAATGCRNPNNLKPIGFDKYGRPLDPNANSGRGPGLGTAIGGNQVPVTNPGPGGGDLPPIHDWPVDPSNPLQAQTVHFDYDKSAIKASEQAKLEAVANYMRSNPRVALRVEGNCDERGTEEYNRSLGSRRSLAGREYLVQLGIDPSRIDVISYGEDKPADPGHDEAAHAKNRRDDFIVLLPPK